MKLYTITDTLQEDAEYGDVFAEDYWIAVWADSEQEAIQFVKSNYSGECRDEDLVLRVAVVAESTKHRAPETDSLHVERRENVLRLAGWRYDGESECDCCGLYANGDDAMATCGHCELCPHCAEDSNGEVCEQCELPKKGTSDGA